MIYLFPIIKAVAVFAGMDLLVIISPPNDSVAIGAFQTYIVYRIRDVACF